MTFTNSVSGDSKGQTSLIMNHVQLKSQCYGAASQAHFVFRSLFLRCLIRLLNKNRYRTDFYKNEDFKKISSFAKYFIHGRMGSRGAILAKHGRVFCESASERWHPEGALGPSRVLTEKHRPVEYSH
jgi:hypothetical protein